MRRRDELDDLSDLWDGKDFESNNKNGHQVLMFVLTLVLAFAVGVASVRLVYGTDVWYDAYALAGRAGLIPGYEKREPFDREEYEKNPEGGDNSQDENHSTGDDGIEIEDPDTGDRFDEEPSGPFVTEKEFFKVENAPVLQLNDPAARSMSVSQIDKLMQPCVVAVVGYINENHRMGYSLGSGVIMSSDGYIITNSHVIEEVVELEVVLHNREFVPAELIANDSTADIAILKIDRTDLTAAVFGRSKGLKVGDQVVAIGCPASLELQGTTTVGNVSALNRKVTMDSSGNRMTFIQTDASVNPGNSGGPLINKYGQVVGIITAKLSAYTYEGIGFAIPIENVADIVADLFEYGHVRGFPSIGIMAKGVSENEIGKHPEGVYVDSVTKGSGSEGKLMRGDIIIAVEGYEVYTVADINSIKSSFKAGDTLHLRVWRMGETIEVDIILSDKYDLN